MTELLDPADPAVLALKAPAKPRWFQPTLLAGVIAGVAYFCWQLGDQFQKIQSFEIYTTPPGIGDLLKLFATFLVVAALAAGLDVKTAFQNIMGTLGIVKRDA